MIPPAGTEGSTTMIIGFGLRLIAYTLASFAVSHPRTDLSVPCPSGTTRSNCGPLST
jgi:hypothetical protein